MSFFWKPNKRKSRHTFHVGNKRIQENLTVDPAKIPRQGSSASRGMDSGPSGSANVSNEPSSSQYVYEDDPNVNETPNTTWEDFETYCQENQDYYKAWFKLLPCVRCADPNGEFFCLNCDSAFCQACKEETHGSYLLHGFRQWNVDEKMYQDVATAKHIFCCSESGKAPQDAKIETKIELVSMSGVMDVLLTLCCFCSPTKALLLKGYFPMSSSDACTVFYAISMLAMLDSLCSRGKLPFQRALTALLTGATFGQARWYPDRVNCHYNRLSRHGTLLRFRQMQMFCSHWPKSCMQCPGPNATRSTVICGDGLFGWQKLKKVGGNMSPTPNNSGLLPYPLVHVDPNTQRVEAGSKPCDSNWRAGALEPKLSARGAARHSIFGYFGLFCRHNFHLVGCNVRSPGERLCYAQQSLIYYLRHSLVSPELIFIYDIGCKFLRHLQLAVSVSGANVTSARCAINAFHANGHKKACRNQFSVRATPGVGLCDGENTERAWAWFRVFGHSLKYMKEDRRAFSMAHIIADFNAQQVLTISNWFVTRLKLIFATVKKCHAELEKLLEESQNLFSTGMLPSSIVNKVQLLALGRQYYQEAVLEIGDSDDPMELLRSRATERQHWYHQMNVSAGQSKANSCRRRMDALTSEIRHIAQTLPEFNRPPLAELLNPDSAVYTSVTHGGTMAVFKQRLVDATNLFDRIAEECNFVTEEWHDVQVKLSECISGLAETGEAGLPAHFRHLLSTILANIRKTNVPTIIERILSQDYLTVVQLFKPISGLVESTDLPVLDAVPDSDLDSSDSEID